MPSDMLAVGVVTSTHGLNGELKVRSFSGSPAHLLSLTEALFRKAGTERLLRLRSVRVQPPGVIVGVEGLESAEQARALVGSEIWVPRSQAAPLLIGEFYAADLCRCRLWFGEEEIGTIRSVWDGGPAQLLEVEARGGKVFLVPFTEHFVGEVDLEAGRIELKEDEIVR
jgi:16S rRNA processing protein RimM